MLSFLKPANASHSWGGYHWARTANPFTLKLGDNVTSQWDAYLSYASTDWSVSDVLDTTIVSGGTTAKRCRATLGRVEVCDSKYGRNGWLGLAQIWVDGLHILQATVKANDTYFNTLTYNTPSWRRMVMCQEVGHTFGLDHQDEDFSNPNLGTCMDYTSNPDGPPSNLQPNFHDYEELDSIYGHLDAITTIGQSLPTASANGDYNSRAEWGRAIRDNGYVALFEKELGGGRKLLTYVIWARDVQNPQ